MRRLCESCEIVIFDRGPFVSFANCGLPYHVGGVIEEEEKLLVATPKLFRDRFDIEVHTETEVTRVDPGRREIEVRELASGEVRRERYDVLVLSPGARAIRPPLPGIDLPGIHVVRTIPDTRRIREALFGSSRAVVVGGGFIGLEMVENLVRRGLEVTVVELAWWRSTSRRTASTCASGPASRASRPATEGGCWCASAPRGSRRIW
jgi:NADPH-dependent 2,4-dienoyl-CoA reductase/sulfur reductase-like enzyme